MKRPSFQFYPGDWRQNANLGRCSFAARGAWLDIMCVLHDSDEYGIVRWPLKELVNSAKVPLALVRELVSKEVLKGADKGANAEEFAYTPRSGRKAGDPVILIPAQPGPVWYSSRMVKDEYIRTIRGESTRFGEGSGEAGTPEKPPRKPSPKGGFGEGKGEAPKPPLGDGASSSSSTSLLTKEVTHSLSGTAACASVEQIPDNPAEAVCRALERSGIPSVSPSHPELLALIGRGVTVEMFVAAAVKSCDKAQPFAYMRTLLMAQLQTVAEIGAAPAVGKNAWDTNGRTIRETGIRLGIGDWDENAFINREQFTAYTERVRVALVAAGELSGT